MGFNSTGEDSEERSHNKVKIIETKFKIQPLEMVTKFGKSPKV